MKVYRAVVANVKPIVVVKRARIHCIPLTTFECLGIYDGIMERGTAIEHANSHFDAFREFIVGLLTSLQENSAYVTVNGKNPFLLFADGGTKAIA